MSRKHELIASIHVIWNRAFQLMRPFFALCKAVSEIWIETSMAEARNDLCIHETSFQLEVLTDEVDPYHPCLSMLVSLLIINLIARPPRLAGRGAHEWVMACS